MKKEKAKADKFEAKCNTAAQKAVDERIAMRWRIINQPDATGKGTNRAYLWSKHGYDPATDPLLVSRSGPVYDKVVAEAYAQACKKARKPSESTRLVRKPGNKRPYRKCRAVAPAVKVCGVVAGPSQATLVRAGGEDEDSFASSAGGDDESEWEGDSSSNTD
jgi:hypothetical protein